jgi:sialate O-acetylesterase
MITRSRLLRSSVALALLGSLAVANSLRADVKPAALFSDHMVLQQGKPVPVWGWADPGEQVTVTLGSQKQTATAGADGKWMVKLTQLKASMDPVEMTIAGKNTVKISDLLVGEVWIGSGQSNMEFPVSKKVASYAGLVNEDQEIAAANYPKIRMFKVRQAKVYEPQAAVAGGEWQVCSPETVPAWSAVGYLFARDLQKQLNVPVGIVTSAVGASCAEAWISRDTLVADPKLKFMVDRFDDCVKYYRADPRPTTEAPKRPTPINKPRTTGGGRGGRGAAAAAPGQPAPQPRLTDPVADQHMPTVCFNGMINPLVPFAIRGVIWYQGESICYGTPGLDMYGDVQKALIKDWRKLWGEDFPFYIVQLPGQQNISNNPRIREEQQEILDLPNTGMAVIIDTGEARNVHPFNKAPLGERLTRIALANAYGQKIEAYGPMYDSMKVEGNTAKVKFTHAAGMKAKGDIIKGFQIAGADQKFVDADAKIEGDTVVVSSPQVSTPVAVRYAFVDFPEGIPANLYNGDDLPAAPFRTDKWKFEIPGIVED